MPSPTLSTVSWVLAYLMTAIALTAFIRGLIDLWRTFSSGTPEPGRTSLPWKRAWQVIWTVISHREFKGRPFVRAAHWLVMVSFIFLSITLISAYVHLRDPHWQLPLLGGFFLWNWLVEVLALLGLVGIVHLMLHRRREGHGSDAEAALSGANPAKDFVKSREEQPRRWGSAGALASRFLGSTRWQARFVEWVILLVCVAILSLRSFDVALQAIQSPQSSLDWLNFPLTGVLGSLWVGADWSETTLANLIVVTSLVKILVSMTWMMVVGIQTSMGIAWHRFLAFANLYTRRNADGSKSLGPAAPMLINGVEVTSPDAFDDIDDDTVLGAGTIADMSWKDRLDLYTCTECGRCQELCPAWNTQKPLSPKLLVMSLRDHAQAAARTEITTLEVTDAEVPGEATVHDLEESGSMLMERGISPSPHSFDLLSALTLSGATGPDGVPVAEAPLVPDVIPSEVLWNCTMCGACVSQCPVDIEHIDHVLDLRRHQVLMKSAFPKELGRAFRGMESKQNPYNQPARKRLEWAKDLDFEVPVVGIDVESAEDVDWLFWVGCAGAFDDRGRATSAAVATLLYTSGVSFAVLGQGESCTGDPARRAGNEPLFQMLAQASIESLTEAKAKNIVVTCAHCFNTIAGEYPQLGGHFNVVHHTQLLNRLVREGRLKLMAPLVGQPGSERTITYHDPCFLGRHNQVYQPPRELVASLPGIELVEMPRSGERAMCCGAGGAHAWFEESRGVRIADARIAEAASTGAEVVATACPFCTQMLGSATGSSVGLELSSTDEPAGSASLPEVKDVAVLLLESVQRAASIQS